MSSFLGFFNEDIVDTLVGVLSVGLLIAALINFLMFGVPGILIGYFSRPGDVTKIKALAGKDYSVGRRKVLWRSALWAFNGSILGVLLWVRIVTTHPYYREHKILPPEGDGNLIFWSFITTFLSTLVGVCAVSVYLIGWRKRLESRAIESRGDNNPGGSSSNLPME